MVPFFSFLLKEKWHDKKSPLFQGLLSPRLMLILLLTPKKDSLEWKDAMVAEYDAIMKKHSWDLAHLPNGKNLEF